MYTIAAKQLRSRTVRVRPPYQGRGAGGSSGARIAHNSSGTRVSTRVVIMARIVPRLSRGATRRLRGLGQHGELHDPWVGRC
jgi:hypothetical protein